MGLLTRVAILCTATSSALVDFDSAGAPLLAPSDGLPPPPLADEAGIQKLSDTTVGCNGAKFKRLPELANSAGGYEVGYRKFVHEGIQTGVWYPAADGTAKDSEKTVVDIRDYLPDAQQGKIGESVNPYQHCDSFNDLPLNTDGGPYPVVVFIHGTGAWKEQSCPQSVHWASRGFIVVSQDHPGLWLKDQLMNIPFCRGTAAKQDLQGDTQIVIDAINNPGAHEHFKFLEGYVDATNVGVGGHSAGGYATAKFAPNGKNVKVALVLGASDVPAAGTNKLDTMMILGAEDALINYSNGIKNFNNAAISPSKFVGLSAAGHLVFSQICSIYNHLSQNIYEVAKSEGICGAMLMTFLFDCDHDLDDEKGWQVINYATTAVLEKNLMCQEKSEDYLENLPRLFTDVEDYMTK